MPEIELNSRAAQIRFFLREVSWCVRLINAEEVRFNPKNLSGLMNAEIPNTANELCEYVHGISWLSNSIPRFAERAAPLRIVLGKPYQMAGGSQKKKSISKNILSELQWNESHSTAFYDLQEQLKESTRLAHRDPGTVLFIHTDASDQHWEIAATQFTQSELEKTIVDQAHQPLAFLSGKFSEREAHWTTYEKQAFAVAQAFRNLDYLLTCDLTTRVFTDHRNLLFSFNPVAMEPSLGNHKVLKVVRWALYLSAFNYKIEHVPRASNTWPDIMTRCIRGYLKTNKVRRIAPALQFNGVPTTPESPEFEWPSRSEIFTPQKGDIN